MVRSHTKNKLKPSDNPNSTETIIDLVQNDMTQNINEKQTLHPI